MKHALVPLAVITSLLGSAAAEDPIRSFASGVELVALDVAVVDTNGRPVRDLEPAEFRLEVGGRSRRVVTAEFLRTAREEGTAEPEPPRETDSTSNESVTPGRLVLLVVDTGSISMGRGRDVIAAASAMLDRLSPTDRVGLLTIPASGPREEFTQDRERIRIALENVSGRAPRPMSRGSFTLAEALACTEGDTPSGTSGKRGMDSERCDTALTREVGSAESARQELREEMWQYATEQQRASSNALAILRSTFEALRTVEGRKVVLLISQGLLFPDMGTREGGGGGEQRELVSAATAAKVAFYVVPADDRAPALTADSKIPPDVAEDDRRLRFWGLESLAVEAGGAVLRGIPERAFTRVISETSAYYRLGFEPEPEERQGKPRKVKIDVSRPGVTVRGRRDVTFPPPGTERERTDSIATVLKSPTQSAELPLRVATWTLRDAQPGKVKVLVGAEIGGGARAAGLQVGYVLLDERGKVTGSATQGVRADAQIEPGRAVPYSTSLTVAPGSYTLRLAGRDERGRLGRVDHAVEARLHTTRILEMSDLLIGPPPTGGRAFRPAVVPDARVGPLLAHGEIYSTDATAPAGLSASLEIATDDDGLPLRKVPVRITESPTPGRVLAQAVFTGEGLAPGRYVARLRVSSAGEPVGTSRRSFTVTADAAIAPPSDQQKP